MCGAGLQVGANLCVEGPAADVGFTASPTSPSSTASGSSATGSSAAAHVSNSPGQRVSTWCVEGFLGLVMGTVLLL